MMRIIRQIGAILLLLVIIPLFVLAACDSALNAAVFNPETYEDAIDDPLLFDELLTVALPAILQAAAAESVNNSPFDGSPINLSELSSNLDEETWREVTRLLIPADWLQKRTEQLLQSTNSIVSGDYSVLDQSFEMAVLQERFQGEEATRAAELIINESPACTAEQEQQLANFLATTEGALPICSPADAELRQQSIDALIQIFNFVGEGLVNNNPDTGDFFAFTERDARQLSLLAELNRDFLRLMYLFPAALLALVIVLAVRSLRDFSRWIGIPLIVVGVLVVVFLLFLQASMITAFTALIAPTNEIEAFGTRLVQPLLREGLAQASSRLLIQASVFIGIGFIILAYAWLERKGHEEEETPGSGEYVMLTEDGRLISSTTQREIGTFTPTPSEIRTE